MNGGAARCAHKGDNLIIISYCLVDSKEASTFNSKALFLDEKNGIKKS